MIIEKTEKNYIFIAYSHKISYNSSYASKKQG